MIQKLQGGSKKFLVSICNFQKVEKHWYPTAECIYSKPGVLGREDGIVAPMQRWFVI